jgi:CubicO group peptidase (beta-lactamase class C family)
MNPSASDDRPLWSGTARVVRGPTVLEEVSAGPGASSGPASAPGPRYQAGSISKLVVAAVVLALVEQRVLDLDEPVARRLDGAPAAWEGITLGQLLSHTSGIGHWGDVPGLGASLLSAPPARADLVAMIEEAPLVAPPGRGWRYSGPGFLVAALVVEAATGEAYGDVAHELVLAPAGLRASTSGQYPAPSAGVATGHRDGESVEPHPGFTALPGTGDLWTTVEDLVALHQALRRGDVVSPASAERFWTPYAVVPGPVTTGPVVVREYGFGTFLGEVRGRPARIHPGDNPGYQSLLAHLPEDDLTVAVLCDAEAPAVDLALASLRSLDGRDEPSGSGT